MRESQFGTSNSDRMTVVIEEQELGGVSAMLERLYNQTSPSKLLNTPDFSAMKELVEDFQARVRDAEGRPIDMLRAIQDLRIIAKEQGWNEDYWNWDVIRKEAREMGYQVAAPKTSEDM
ncbi:MAG: hypothetical protein HY006_03915 [Candidatus Sungbacteria bacterium]|nr:hypothetical protein [Candidatus Sungbacteria bacterium]